jgi:hypothetical protein
MEILTENAQGQGLVVPRDDRKQPASTLADIRRYVLARPGRCIAMQRFTA